MTDEDTLDVGNAGGEFTKLHVGETRLPVIDLAKISGSMQITERLDQDEVVVVSIGNADGQIIASTRARIDVGHKHGQSQDAHWIERVVTAKPVDG